MQRPTFVQTIHHLYLNSADRKGRDTGNNKIEQRSQELDWDIHMSCMHFHSLPSAREISVGPVCDPQNQVVVIGLTGMIWKGKARRVDSADTVCVQETTCIQMLMASEFCPLIFCLLVYITSCIHGLCAGNPSDLTEWLPCSSQTACIRPVIAHVYPPGDVNWSIRGLPLLQAVLPTSCVQGADITMIINRNEKAHLCRRQLFRNNAPKNLSVMIMSDRLVNS